MAHTISRKYLSLAILLAGLSLAFAILFSLAPQSAQAQGSAAPKCDPGYKAQGALCIPDTGVTGGFASETTVGGFLLRVVRVLLVLTGVIAVLFIIIGGFRYMTSSGNQEAADKGKKMVVNALIGLIIVVLSYTIVTILIRTITTGDVIGTGGGGGTVTCPNGQPPLPNGDCTK